jgi:NAD(P)H-hydrate epimerase
MTKFPKLNSSIPSLTKEQMTIIDDKMINYYHIELIQMMENAGRSLAFLINHYFFNNKVKQKKLLFLIGSGGNGGGALVCARHLFNRDADITILLTKIEKHLSPITAHQLNIIHKLDIPVYTFPDKISIKNSDLIVDGILGYNIKGAPNHQLSSIIQNVNSSRIPVVSLDIPSGLEPDSGIPHHPTIKANATLTLALPKRGLLKIEASPYVGDLFLTDIGVPPSLYSEKPFNFNLNNIFSKSYIIKLDK